MGRHWNCRESRIAWPQSPEKQDPNNLWIDCHASNENTIFFNKQPVILQFQHLSNKKGYTKPCKLLLCICMCICTFLKSYSLFDSIIIWMLVKNYWRPYLFLVVLAEYDFWRYFEINLSWLFVNLNLLCLSVSRHTIRKYNVQNNNIL